MYVKKAETVFTNAAQESSMSCL